MKALRLEIYQPTAHYRIPYSVSRRLTYPIPPYSTVIGFLCNACGIYDAKLEIYEKIIKELKIAIAGRFAVKHTEYVWFRNLAKKYHVDYYGAESIRDRNGEVGHIGGQMPMRVDVLEDVELIIHLYHEKVELLKEKLETLEDRLEPVHLGRAEDWIVIKDLKFVDIEWKYVDDAYDYYFWIPETVIDVDWKEVEGIVYNITTILSETKDDYDYRHNKKRTYKRIRAKLNSGSVRTYVYFDPEKELPVFFGGLWNESLG